MNFSRNVTRPLILLVLMLAAAVPRTAAAQTLRSNVGQVQIFANPFEESLSLLVTPGGMAIDLAPNYAYNEGNTPLTVNLDFVLSPFTGTQPGRIFYYFAQSDALVNGGSAIPSTNFSATFLGAGDHPFQNLADGRFGTYESIALTGSGTHVSTLFSLRVSTIGVTLVPGTYAGTLFVQAEVH